MFDDTHTHLGHPTSPCQPPNQVVPALGGGWVRAAVVPASPWSQDTSVQAARRSLAPQRLAGVLRLRGAAVHRNGPHAHGAPPGSGNARIMMAS